MREINCFMAGKTSQINKFPPWSHELGGSSWTPTFQNKNVFSSAVIKKLAQGQNIFACLLITPTKVKIWGLNCFQWLKIKFPDAGGQNLNLNNFVLPISRNVFLGLERVVLVKSKGLHGKKSSFVVIVDKVHSNWDLRTFFQSSMNNTILWWSSGVKG